MLIVCWILLLFFWFSILLCFCFFRLFLWFVFRSLNLFDFFFFCGIYFFFLVFIVFVFIFWNLFWNPWIVFFQLFFDILLTVWDFFRMFQILFARIATFRSSPLRSITGLFMVFFTKLWRLAVYPLSRICSKRGRRPQGLGLESYLIWQDKTLLISTVYKLHVVAFNLKTGSLGLS